MKNVIIIGTIFLFLGLFMSSAQAQCNAEKYTEACIPKLKDGFNFVKSFKVDGKGGSKEKVEFSYVFAKGTQYFINICNDGEETDGIVVTLYDSNRKKMTTNKINGKYYPAIIYPCNSTGIYYITFTFENSKNNCGGSVLGFKR